MKLSSKSQGYSEGEISLLSIFETLAASAVAIWFAYLPAYLYRWSLKSTVLFWSPLIWIVRPLRKIDDVVHFMRQVKLLSIYRVARIYSCIVLVLVAAKLYLLLLAANLLIHLEKVPGWETLAKYIVPDQLPIWHVAGTLNALLSLGLFFLSDYFLNEISSSKRVPIDTIRRIFETMLTVRNTLSVYSCLCIAYISVQVGGAFKLPPLEAKLFPW